MVNIDSDLAIIGGGIVGSVLAIDLARQGFGVILVDQSDRQLPSRAARRHFALSLGSCNYLQTLGLADLITRSGEPINAVMVTEGTSGKGVTNEILELNPYQIGAVSFGCMMPEDSLMGELNSKLAQEDRIEVVTDVKINAIERYVGTVTVESSSQFSRAVRVAVICDGQQGSLTRSLGFSFLTKDYEQSALTCVMRRTQPNNGVARQYFLPTGPLAVLPIGSHEECIVWTSPSSTTQDLMRLDAEAFQNRIQSIMGDHLGALSVIGDRTAWPLSLAIAHQIAQNRVALAGDAVRKIHPLAGQGLNLGLRDAAAFAEVLTRARRRGEDVGFDTVLERYQRWRQFDSTAFTTITDRFNWIYLQNAFEFRLVRKFGVGLLNRVPTLKALLIREAAGLAGDIPKAMRADD